jgi:transcriptional regulator of acetoin/glycerol metabolism
MSIDHLRFQIATAASDIELVVPSSDPLHDLERLHANRELFIDRGELADSVRALVRRCWLRSAAWGIHPESRRLEHVREPRLDERVAQSMIAVLPDLTSLMSEIGGVGLYTDGDCTIAHSFGDPTVERTVAAKEAHPGAVLTEDVAGNNAVGTAAEEMRGVQIWSAEHYVEACHGFLCTALPIHDPLSRKIVGVLSLSIPERDANRALAAAMARIAAGAVSGIEQRLVDQLAVREQALLCHYLQAVRKRAGGAVMAFDGRTTIASNAALSLLQPEDYAALTAYAEETLRVGHSLKRHVVLSTGCSVQLTATPKFDGGDSVGVIVQLRQAPVEPVDTRPQSSAFGHLVGRSESFRHAVDLAATSSVRSPIICIVGEPGTGKFALAEAIVSSLGRQCAVIDCATIDPRAGQFDRLLRSDRQNASTLIIRHADALRSDARRVLLRFLQEATEQERHVILTIRGTAGRATSWPAAVLSAQCLQVFLTPLRERRDDIPLLIESTLAQIDPGRHIRPTPALMQAAAQAEWPGNVRQLEAAVRSAAALAGGRDVNTRDLPDDVLLPGPKAHLSRLEQLELMAITKALRETNGNRSHAASVLGIGRSTLYRRLDAFRLHGFNVNV